MKEEAIKKINTLGKVGQIIAIIAKIFVILALTISLLLTVASAFIPKEFITILPKYGMSVFIDMSVVGKSITKEEQEQIIAQSAEDCPEGGTLTVSDGLVTYSLTPGKDDTFDSLYVNQSIHVDDSTIKYEFVGTDPQGIHPHNLFWFLLSILLYIIMTLITVTFVERLCKAFRNCQSPFEESVTKKMTTFAYSLIPWVVLDSVVQTGLNYLMHNRIQFQLSVNLDMVFIILVILALVFIFKYGAVLQQESDETL